MLLVLAIAAAILSAGALPFAAAAEPPDRAGPEQDMDRRAAATLTVEDVEPNRRQRVLCRVQRN